MPDIKELIAEARHKAWELRGVENGMMHLNKGDLAVAASLIESLCSELVNKQDKIEIVIDDETKLIADCYDPHGYREIGVGIEKKGVYYQDLALVKQSHNDLGDGGFAHVPDKYDVYVWGDCDADDYTNRFVVNEYREDQ